MFILFEGVEGSGKTTQTRRLERRLSGRGWKVLRVREPGGTAAGNAVRRLLKHRVEIELTPLTELLLFAAARAQLVSQIIRPALERGIIVIADRFAESTLAYQGYGRGIDLEVIRTVNALATGGLRPDLIVLLDLDPQEGLRRKGTGAANDRFEREALDFHQRVRNGYLEMARAEPNRWLILDASAPAKAVAEAVWQRVRSALTDRPR